MSQTIIAQTFPNRLRIPPQSLDAEIALLGSIMLRPEALYDVTEIVILDSFYSEKHRVIFETMMELLRNFRLTQRISTMNSSGNCFAKFRRRKN